MIGYKFDPLREPWSMIRRNLLNLMALLAIVFLFPPPGADRPSHLPHRSDCESRGKCLTPPRRGGGEFVIDFLFEPLREPWSMMRSAFLWVSISFVRPEPNEMRRPHKAVGEGHEPSARGPGTLQDHKRSNFLRLGKFEPIVRAVSHLTICRFDGIIRGKYGRRRRSWLRCAIIIFHYCTVPVSVFPKNSDLCG